jgi:nifR3 family TIM-barrel protein
MSAPAPSIGAVRLDNPFLLAPMAGVSDPPFRRLCRQGGAGMVCAEMVSANALHFGDKRSLGMLEVFPDEHPVSLQVFGAEPDRLAAAARRAEEAGADVVDLNCGCPVRKITSGGAGIGLMNDESNFARCVEAMSRAVRVPVTVKIRLGRLRGENRGPRFARLAESAGAAAVFVHARSMEDRHSGPPDLTGLKETVESVRIPVFGNGGVRTAEEARLMMDGTGCAGVLIGQAAMGNPFIFAELLSGEGAPPAAGPRRRLELLRWHARMNVEYFGEERGLVRLRKTFGSYMKGLPRAAEFRGRAYQIRDLASLDRLVDEALAAAG